MYCPDSNLYNLVINVNLSVDIITPYSCKIKPKVVRLWSLFGLFLVRVLGEAPSFSEIVDVEIESVKFILSMFYMNIFESTTITPCITTSI